MSDLSLSNFKDVILRETGPNDRVSVFETCKGGGLKGSGTFSGETASPSAGSLGCPVCSSLCASLEAGSSCGSSASQVLGCKCASLTPFSDHTSWEGVSSVCCHLDEVSSLWVNVHVCMCLAVVEKLQLI